MLVECFELSNSVDPFQVAELKMKLTKEEKEVEKARKLLEAETRKEERKQLDEAKRQEKAMKKTKKARKQDREIDELSEESDVVLEYTVTNSRSKRERKPRKRLIEDQDI